MKLSAREQKTILAVALFGIAIVWMYAALMISPLMREAGKLAQRVRESNDRLNLLKVATANEAALREQHRQLEETVQSLRNLLPPEEAVPQVIELLSDLARQSQVKIETIVPQRNAGAEEPPKSKAAQGPPAVYKDVFIQIDAVAGFHQLGTFLSLVETGEKPMQVSSLHIATDSKDIKRMHVKLLIRAYFAANPTALTGKKS